jgi:hypothetical protein
MLYETKDAIVAISGREDLGYLLVVVLLTLGW